MQQMLNVITLGTGDLERARAFYERLGWSPFKTGEVVMFRTPGAFLSLFPRQDLAADARVPAAGSGFTGVALAYCARSQAEVDDVLRQAVDAGATLTKPASETFWGGYSGYFADPDGFLWEVASHPEWKFDEQGRVLSL